MSTLELKSITEFETSSIDRFFKRVIEVWDNDRATDRCKRVKMCSDVIINLTILSILVVLLGFYIQTWENSKSNDQRISNLEGNDKNLLTLTTTLLSLQTELQSTISNLKISLEREINTFRLNSTALQESLVSLNERTRNESIFLINLVNSSITSIQQDGQSSFNDLQQKINAVTSSLNSTLLEVRNESLSLIDNFDNKIQSLQANTTLIINGIQNDLNTLLVSVGIDETLGVNNGITLKPIEFEQTVIRKIPIQSVSTGVTFLTGFSWGHNLQIEVRLLFETSVKSMSLVTICSKLRHLGITQCVDINKTGDVMNLNVTLSGFLQLNLINNESNDLKFYGQYSYINSNFMND